MNRMLSGWLSALVWNRIFLPLLLLIFAAGSAWADLESEITRKNKQLADQKKAVHALTEKERARRVLHFKDGRLVSDETASGRGN